MTGSRGRKTLITSSPLARASMKSGPASARAIAAPLVQGAVSSALWIALAPFENSAATDGCPLCGHRSLIIADIAEILRDGALPGERRFESGSARRAPGQLSVMLEAAKHRLPPAP